MTVREKRLILVGVLLLLYSAWVDAETIQAALRLGACREACAEQGARAAMRGDVCGCERDGAAFLHPLLSDVDNGQPSP